MLRAVSSKGQNICFRDRGWGFDSPTVHRRRKVNAEIAQSVRASVSYAEGYQFDSDSRYKKFLHLVFFIIFVLLFFESLIGSM